jgi:hypothetical protein
MRAGASVATRAHIGDHTFDLLRTRWDGSMRSCSTRPPTAVWDRRPLTGTGTIDETVARPAPPWLNSIGSATEISVSTDSSQPTTPSGLPVRVPQAGIAPPLCTDGPDAPANAQERRPPEEIRGRIAGLQAGAQRGRSDAAASAQDLPAAERP